MLFNSYRLAGVTASRLLRSLAPTCTAAGLLTGSAYSDISLIDIGMAGDRWIMDNSVLVVKDHDPGAMRNASGLGYKKVRWVWEKPLAWLRRRVSDSAHRSHTHTHTCSGMDGRPSSELAQ